MRLTSYVRQLGNYSGKKRLQLSYHNHLRSGRGDKRIPSPEIFSLYASPASISAREYSKSFCENACLRELPELLRIAGYDESQESFSLYDFGCGLGRLAYAFTNYFGSSESRQYAGYEILTPAVDFLRDAYSDYPNINFFSDKVLLEKSYIEIAHLQDEAGKSGKTGVDTKNVKLAGRSHLRFDLQYSHSVFTHMDQESIINALAEFRSLVSGDGLCVNTWLIIDKFAEASLRAGLADRELPYEVDGYLTYSKENPLICAAYRFQQVKEIYDRAGHEIVGIHWGAWSGRLPTQQFSAQDVVVSKPK